MAAKRKAKKKAKKKAAPKKKVTEPFRIDIGGGACTQPYSASVLNVSAMSFGSLSATAVESLNRGCQETGCLHNTGEGGISPYHLNGGNLIWQLGTGYFGARNTDGTFSQQHFLDAIEQAKGKVKAIEIKLSQGAKPGLGGMLPAAKVSPEIAPQVPPGTAPRVPRDAHDLDRDA